MTYTTHGLMTAEDMAEIRADYDLDMCPCCESGDGGMFALDLDAVCVDCGH